MYQELIKIIEESKGIVFFGGAGVSTESGVPDFRSENGLYHAQQIYKRSPEQMISHSFFEENQDTFYDYYKNNMIYREAKPNRAHLALAKLEEEGKLKAVITQNIDGLHQMAGSKKVFELHGSVLRNNCIRCDTFYDLEYIMDPSNCLDEEGKQSWVPRCKKCSGVIKPDVVLYEEPLKEDVIYEAIDAISKADTLIVGGTSLVVYPAAGYLSYFHGRHLVLINKSQTQYDNMADLIIREPIAEVLGSCVL
jgi:NAD-dependent deacetylase